jgi:Zn-finger protein
MEQSYRYFKNEKCRYFPCHSIDKDSDFNCLFCYCPLNPYKDCLGNPEWIERESGRKIKNCTNCTFPHKPENYDRIVKFLSEKMR